MSRRKLAVVALLALTIVGFFAFSALRFPSDKTPEGAYARIALAVTRGEPRAFFPYLETRAQWASYTIRDYRKKAYDRIEASYPEPERGRLLNEYRSLAEAKDGEDAFTLLSQRRGFLARLRRDLSGIASVEVEGERATIETARGSRYPFRVRDNGIWGLTLFTAELEAEAERAARDFELVERAANDYEMAASD